MMEQERSFLNKFRKFLLHYSYKMKKHLLLFLILLSIFWGILAFPKTKKNTIDTEKNLITSWAIENITGTLRIAPDQQLLATYIKSLEESKNISIQTYEFTKREIKNTLKKLADTQHQISIMIENKKFQQFQNTFTALQEEFSAYPKIQIRSDQHLATEYLHSKITLVDSGFWIQTANLTHSSFANNREHFFYSNHSGVLQSLRTIFKKDWEGIPLEISDLHPNLLVCNINCRKEIESMLNSAQKSIKIQTQYITDPRIFLLLSKKIANVEIQLILSDSIDNKKILKYFGPKQVKLIKKPYIHTKMIAIDDQTLLLGSMNLSENSLDNNREIWILLYDPKLIQQFLEGFEKDWK